MGVLSLETKGLVAPVAVKVTMPVRLAAPGLRGAL
jgi:hypothetical protein